MIVDLKKCAKSLFSKTNCCILQQIKQRMQIITLSPFEQELNVKKNDQLKYSYTEHVSVGYTADFEIENQEILIHLETDTAYRYPEKMKEGMTGGDAANTTFTFGAIAEGTTLLIIRKYYRSELETEYRFRINIK